MKTKLHGYKLIVALSFLLGSFYQSAAQSTEWVVNVGGNGADFGQVIAIDGAGNTYVAGQFQQTADFDPGNGISSMTSAGNYDVFIAKYSATSDLMWARQIGGTSADIVNAIAVDTGSVYITGSFSSTADFDPGPLTDNLTSAGFTDMYILKLDTAGNYKWAKRIGGNDLDAGRGIAIDGAGNVYTTGSFVNTVDFNPSATATYNLTTSGTGAQDVFVSKLDALGDFVWAKQMGGDMVEIGYGIALDAANNIFVTGMFFDTANFNTSGGTTNLISVGEQDAFVVELDPLGDFVWATSFGDTTADYGKAINFDGAGNVYVAGNMTDGTEVFLNKYDASGILTFSVHTDSLNSQCIIELYGFDVDGMGNAYLSGSFIGTMDLDPSASGVQSVTSSTAFGPDGFILKLDQLGALNWHQHLSPAMAIAFDVTVDKQIGTIYVAGGFNGSNTDFGGILLSSVSPAPDIFVLKIDNPILSVKMSELKGQVNSDGRSLLSWHSFSETNNEGFYVERSANGKDFVTLGRVASQYADGNSISLASYNFTDPAPLKSRAWYRLNQKDKNGRTTYSNTVVLDPNAATAATVTISPNPATDKILVQKTTSFNNSTIKILNTMGRVVKQYAKVNGTSVQADLSDLATGTYFMVVEENGNSQKLSLVKR